MVVTDLLTSFGKRIALVLNDCLTSFGKQQEIFAVLQSEKMFFYGTVTKPSVSWGTDTFN